MKHMRIQLIVMLPFFLSSFAPQGRSATLEVPDDYPTIQTAIDAAVDGDTVLVAPGTYFENISFQGKAILVKSSDGAQHTTIDGSKPICFRRKGVVLFAKGEGSDSVLNGFTLTNGTGFLYFDTIPRAGGGIYCSQRSSPTIINNIIRRNTSGYFGAGIYCAGDAVIANNLITENSNDGTGGGIHCGGNAQIIENTIINNSSHNGAGIFSVESPYIANNTIADNATVYWGWGGGIYCHGAPFIEYNIIAGNSGGSGGGIASCWHTSSPCIQHNLISGNSGGPLGTCSRGGGMFCYCDDGTEVLNNVIVENGADAGGGIYCYASNATIENNLINNNAANGDGSGDFGGGGINCYFGEPAITNNILLQNSAYWGGGLFLDRSSPSLSNCTLFGNTATVQGGGIYCLSSSINVINTILWNDSAVHASEIYISMDNYGDPSVFAIQYSDVEGGKDSVYLHQKCTLNWSNMIEKDPLFADPLKGDVHLSFPSPCKDAGWNEYQPIPAEDFEGDPRIAYGIVDMGADEFHRHLYSMGNASPGGNVEVKITDTPATSPVVLWVGSDLLDDPISTPYGMWHLHFPILTTLLLPPIPSPSGLLVLPVGIPPHYPVWNVPIQAIVGMHLSNPCVIPISD